MTCHKVTIQFLWLLPSMVLLAVVMLSSTVNAYAVVADGFSFLNQVPSVAPLVPSKTKGASSSSPFLVTQDVREKKAVSVAKYDLGIGKNAPIHSHNRKHETTPFAPAVTDIDEACRYLVEHEAVRMYPSPLQQDDGVQDRGENTLFQHKNGANKNKQIKKIRYNRRSEDVLLIFEHGDDKIINKGEEHVSRHLKGNQPHNHNRNMPVIVAHTTNKLDLNTAWVEMLAHCEDSRKG